MPERIIDISTGISVKTAVYEGDPLPQIEKVSSIENDGFVVSRISIGTHTGTHVDAPSHIFNNGKTIDELHVSTFTGKAVLLDLSSGDFPITADELEKAYVPYNSEDNVNIILIRSKNSSSYSLDPDVGRKLAPTAGTWILEHGFQVVGVDTLSVDTGSSLVNHELFLQNEMNIVEYLHLSEVVPGIYYFMCLPLKLVGCDGSPARAVLMDMSFFD